MDIFTAIRERRSCRAYSSEPIGDEMMGKLLEAAIWAPSPANNQPWEFIVITNGEIKSKIFDEAEFRRRVLFEKSGWKWVNRYNVGFLKEAPAIIAVIGDPKKTGADMFLAEGGMAYQHACAAAIQNINLAAYALGLGTLWFTLYDRDAVREILGVDPKKEVIALVCVGRPSGEPMQTPRKGVQEKTTYLR